MPSGAFLISPFASIRNTLLLAVDDWYFPIIVYKEVSGHQYTILNPTQIGIHPVTTLINTINCRFSKDTTNKRVRETRLRWDAEIELILQFDQEVDFFEWEEYLGSDSFLRRFPITGTENPSFDVLPVLTRAEYNHPTRQAGNGTEVKYSFDFIMSRK